MDGRLWVISAFVIPGLALLIAIPSFIVDTRQLTQPPTETVPVPPAIDREAADLPERSEHVIDEPPTERKEEGMGGGGRWVTPGAQSDTPQPPPQQRPGDHQAQPAATGGAVPLAPDLQPPAIVISLAMVLGRPTRRAMERNYPPGALNRGDTARVTLSCQPLRSGRFFCRVTSAPNPDFDAAALNLAENFRLSPNNAARVTDETPEVEVPIRFDIREERASR